MSKSKDIITQLKDVYYNNAAGFTTRFTNIFEDIDGKKQDLYPKQIFYLNGLKKSDRIVAVVKSRQCGISTSIMAKETHNAFWYKVPESLITSTNERSAMRVLDRIKKAFYSMPEFMRPEFKVESKSELELANGAKIYSLPASADSLRGFSGNVTLDEFSLKNRQDSEEIYTAAIPILTKGWNLTAVGTPKHVDCVFADMVNEAVDSDGNIKYKVDRILKILYTDVPHVMKGVEELDLQNRLLPAQFNQEYLCQFVQDAESSMFPYDLIMDKLIDESLDLLSIRPIEEFNSDIIPNEMRQQHLKKDYKEIYAAWDIAISGDNSIIGLFGVDEKDNWQLLSYKKFPKNTDVNTQVLFASKFCQYFCVNKLIYDSTGPLGKTVMGIIKNSPIRSISKPFEFTNKSKSLGYGELRAKIETETFFAPKIDEMIKEFLNLGYNPVTERISAQGGHRNTDDWPSIFMMAYQARKRDIVQPGFSIIIPGRN